ncbi:MAG: membrane protein [Pirellulaceae bacterium]|nr:MAG: membrane protein [Pirellulaceae bacterium]
MREACWAAWGLLILVGLLPARYSIYPGRRLAWLLGLPVLLAAGTIWMPELAAWLIAADVALAVVLWVDCRRLPRASDLRVERRFVKVASLDRRHEVRLIVASQGRRCWTITVRDDLSPDDGRLPEDLRARIEPGQSIQWRYGWVPRRRGVVYLRAVHVRADSPWKLWYRQLRIVKPAEIHVYPNIRQLAEYALLVRTNRLNLLGVRRVRKWGQDHDFERLRDYTPDDNYRHIEWRATARRRKLTVKDFQISQSQRVMLLLDCGRMMAGSWDGMSLLDHALNAALMLAYAALRQGDSVGLVCFGNELTAFVPPRSGLTHMRQLVRGVFDQQPRMVQPRYDRLLARLGACCRKRTLMVLISNVVDQVSRDGIEQLLASQRRRHLTLAVLLRDPSLFAPLEEPSPPGTRSWYRAAAAAVVAQWRNDMIQKLQHGGHLVLDVSPSRLTSSLISEYLAIKAAHLL